MTRKTTMATINNTTLQNGEQTARMACARLGGVVSDLEGALGGARPS